MVYAWPIAQIAVMGAEGAADIIYKQEIARGEKTKAEFVKKYEDTFMNPYIAAKRGYVDEVILPEETRSKLIEVFELYETKQKDIIKKKHGNIPL